MAVTADLVGGSKSRFGWARLGGVLIGLAAVVLPGSGASARPDRTATLDHHNPTYSWQGSGSGVPDPSAILMPAPALHCSETPYDCDYTLVDVREGGRLSLTVETGGLPHSSTRDIDAFIYESNPAGDPIGRPLTRDCATGERVEMCEVEVGAGLYVVEVEYFQAVAGSYVATVDLAPLSPAPPSPPAPDRMVTADDCEFTLYYFKDSAERLADRVPPGYQVRPYPAGSVLMADGTATIAAAAYDCARLEIPGSVPAPGIFTVLSVVVYPESGAFEGAATADFYALWIHADNEDLVDLLAAEGMPALHVPGMRFDRPALSLKVDVDVPWTAGPYALATTGYHQDVFHPHENTFLHVAPDGRLARMDFVTRRARDHFCFQPTDDHHHLPCGEVSAHPGSPVADLFGGADRTAHNTWDHDPLERSWFILG